MSEPGESGRPGNDAESEQTGSDADPGSADDSRAVDRVDYDPDYDPAQPVLCEVCGAEMHYTAACKLRCPRCGYARDCSDP